MTALNCRVPSGSLVVLFIHKIINLFECVYVTTWLLFMEEYCVFLSSFQSFPKTSCSLYACVYKGTQLLTRMRTMSSGVANLEAHAHGRSILGRIFIARRNVVLRRSLNKEPDDLNLKVKGSVEL